MKIQKLIGLIFLLALLVVGVVVKSNHDRAERVSMEAKSVEVVTFNKELEFSAVRKITVTKGLDTTSQITMLKNDQNAWTMPTHFGAGARKSLAEELIKKLTALKGELRSDSDGVLVDYKIDDSQGLHVVLENASGKVLTHTVLSLERPGRSGNFVRTTQGPTVIVSKEDILMILGFYSKDSKLDPKNFMDLKVANFDASKVKRLELVQPDSKFGALTLVQSGSGAAAKWAFEPVTSDEIDPSKMSEFLSNASSVYAMDALDPAGTSYGFSAKPWIRVTGEDQGKPFEISYTLGKKVDADKSIYLKVLPAGNVYSVSEGNLEYLSKKDKVFFIKPESTEAKK